MDKLLSGRKRWELCELNLYTPVGQFNVIEHEGKWSVQFCMGGLLQMFTKFNWYTWQLFDFTAEYEPYGPLYSLRFHILGVGLYVGINPPWETKESIELDRKCSLAKEQINEEKENETP